MDSVSSVCVPHAGTRVINIRIMSGEKVLAALKIPLIPLLRGKMTKILLKVTKTFKRFSGSFGLPGKEITFLIRLIII
ncbi:hypothetical protein GF312_06725 [Candidatus Poribacteria bacterium]|nr:hypothetical protein [Candidatus Poribacteria bacterium]